VHILILFENFKMALDSIVANKLRAFLTMLGIIIGISSVIAIVSLGRGGQEAITGEFEKIGASTINVKVNQNKAGRTDGITLEDVRNIREKVDTIRYATPMLQRRGTIKSDLKSKTAIISGGTVDMAYIENADIVYGRYFSEREYDEGKAVLVINEAAATSLFGYKDVVGESVKVGPRASMKKAVIVGVVRGFTNPFGDEDNNMPAFVSMPLTFVQSLYPSEMGVDTLSIMATSRENGEVAGNSARSILESRHNNRGKDIYIIENALKEVEQVNRVVGIFTAFIGAVAAISLVVGGIGVMNIMLVSVTERTREIGIRKALGATTVTILAQFLTEAVIISVIGGVIGMILGIVGAKAVGGLAGITPVLSTAVILQTIMFSSAVGIFFGIYPARKAAQLDPIDALRYE
jgi:putative ABC transport system permease protein